MPQAQGSSSQIIYAEEATFGTTPGTPNGIILPFISENFGEKRTLIATKVIRSSREMTKPVRGRRDISGSITTELDPYMGTLLKHLLGGYSAPSGGSPYTHVIKVGALPVGLCIEKGFLDLTTPEYILYNGCRINKMSFSLKDEGAIATVFDFLGAKETVGVASIDSTPTDLTHAPFDAFEATLKEGGSSIAIISQIDFEVNNGLDGNSYVIGGAGVRRAIPGGKCAVTGKITALFEDVTLYTKAANLTETSIEIILTRGTGAGSAGNELLDIVIPEIYYERNAPLIKGPEGVLVELPFSAFYDNATEATSLQMTLKNTTAAL